MKAGGGPPGRPGPRSSGTEGFRAGLAAALLALGLPVGSASAQPAVLAPEEHAAETRPLAERHLRDLERLHVAIARCIPGVGVRIQGIAFRRPRGRSLAAPALTLWVWVEGEPPPGRDYGARAAAVFTSYGQPLFRHLLASSPVFQDPEVGGYGLILSWLAPPTGPRLVAESLAVFVDKLTAANFAHESIGPATFLARADTRRFEGRTELAALPLPVDDAAMPRHVRC